MRQTGPADPARPIAVDDPDDPRLADYRGLSDGELQRRTPDPAFIAEGILVIGQLLRSSYAIRSFLVTPAKLARLTADPAGLDTLGPDVPVYVAAPAVMNATAGFNIHRGALASAARRPLPTAASLLASARLVLLLEGINDHENLGALFRNAAAFGADAVLLSPRCADPLYRRSVRVSLGHVLDMPYARLEPWPDGLELVARAGFRLLALTPDREAPSIEAVGPVARDGPAAVLVGAEGPGLSPPARARATLSVRIPIAAGVDSLNVATAAAIGLHRLADLAGPSITTPLRDREVT